MSLGAESQPEGIAIVGLAGRFPGARNVAQFWQNLAGGVESIRFFSDDDFRRAGLDPAAFSKDPDFVPARSVLDDVDLFDAPFFGIDAREAELMDPQHRVFLEVASEALEDAACDPDRYPGAIGLFAGLSLNTYLLANLCSDRQYVENLAASYQLGEFQTILGNDKDFLTTRVAYKLNLRGPVMTVQTACSTSLVAVAQACQSLQNFQCDTALAGAVSITFPQIRGYRYQEGAMGSADGHCRTFDAAARGTVFGDGCGIVVLKRLADAIADGDCIRAVIKGAAINNDGSGKVSYTAPSVEGQAEVIAAAQALANVQPESISYIEAHGTATPLGDPIEVAALTQAFRIGTDKKQFCAIGSAKTNFGHLDVASGVTGLIKTTLALEHRLIPPSLHFSRPNPQIDFENSPFFVNTEARPWRRNGGPLRAGVSSFGVGGTNAHVILEEAPTLPERPPKAGPQILILSTRTRAALDAATENLAAHLDANPGLDLRDVAFTLQTGRRAYDFRRFILCDSVAEAILLLRSPDPACVFTRGGRLPAGESPLQVAGRHWLMGQPVDWPALHGDTRPRRIPLPPHPFERQRYWIELPHRKLIASPVESAVPLAAPLPSAAPTRDTVLAEVKSVFTELSGENLAAADPATSFFDLGLDSLFLTQAAQALRKKFNVKITFRQLLDNLSAFDALVDYILPLLPAAHSVPAPSAVGSTAGPSGPLDRMTQQLSEISKQIEALRSGSPAPSLPSAPEPRRFGPYKPIDRSVPAGFTPAQQAHLDALIARYTARTPKSKDFAQRHRAHFADPRAVAGFRPFWKEMVYPIVAQRSKGARIWDIDGNEYVDVTMGFGTNLFGHSPDFVTDAVRRQLDAGVEVGPSSTLAGEAAELFCELTGNERVTFCSTGSEAILGAIRLARTVTGRTKIATTSEAYHGICDEVLVRSAGGKSQPIAPGIPAHAVSEVIVIEWGNPASLDLLRAHAHELAAVLVESVQSRRPEIQPVEFIREIRRITQESGAALILDEVITGFRAHPGGVQALWNIRADLVTYGKVIGGGMPIGAIGGRAEYMDALDGGAWQYGDASFPEVGVTFFAGTYVRHPLAMAATKAVLEHIRDAGPELQRDLAARTDRFTAELNAFFESESAPIRATHFTSMMYFQFGDTFRYPGLLFFHLREKGLHIWEGRPWFLSTAHTEADVQFILRAFRETILELKQGGFIADGTGEIEQKEAKVTKEEKKLAEPAAPVLHPVHPVHPVKIPAPLPAIAAQRAPLFSVYFFGNYPAEYSSSKYRLIIEATRLADTRGFHAVWLPERHFHPLGGFSPNPSLLAAALARETSRIRLHGGSVVVPLHHPVRIAEEWSVVDNLSNGRAGISFASGWHPNDFIFAPGNFENRRELYYEGIDLVRRLWRGESANFQTGGATRLDVQILPRPKQPELPTWFTCIHRDAFVKAGELGANVLCHTVNQSLDEIAGKVAAYREARARAGFDPGHVTLLVHTFIGENAAQAVEQARRPFYDYLASFLDNGKKKAESHGRQVELAREDMDEILALSYDDYVANKALIGSVESCAAVIDKLTAIGIDELGCFIDFGVDTEAALSSLERVAELKRMVEERREAPSVLTLPHAQRGLWTLINTGDNASRVYNESITLALRGPANIDALRQSLQFLVDRHEALRAIVSPDGDSQEIVRDCPIDLDVRDFSPLNGARDAGVREFFSEREAALFDFSRPPVMRASLAALSAGEHLLLLTFHHLTGNGPSYTMFLDEFAAAYDAFARGELPRLEPALQLHDFVAWRAAQESRQQDSEQFWLNQFQGALPVLDLPADHPRPAIQTFRGGRQILTLDEPLVKSLKAAAAGQRCSLFMLLFTAYGVLLHRLSGQDDVVIGVAADAEIRAEEGGRSLFANTTHMMPLRCRIAGEAPFAERIRASKQLILDASEHQQYFFGDLLKRLGLPRDLSRSPLFSVTFNLETGEFRKQAGGVDFEWATDPLPYRSPAGAAMFDLYMNVAERNGGLLCELDHSEIFEPETARRWLGHFRALLEQIAQDPAAPISKLTLLTEPEKLEITAGWNDTARSYPGDALLHRLVEEQAARTPDAVAVSFGAETLTYAEMNARAGRIAHYLRTIGVRRDVPVAVCLERSLDLPVALLAVLKAGGAYVPIDPGYPAERVQYMLRDCAAPVVLAADETAPRLRLSGGPRFVSPAAAAGATGGTHAPLSANEGPDDLAYIMYTSGSTGMPKGAMISHRAICNHMFWMLEEFPLGDSDRVLQKTPAPFDASVWEFWAPLISRARLVMAPPGAHRDSREIANLVHREQITILQLVPSMAALVADEPGLSNCTTLRRLFCGGEPLSPELCEKFFARLPDCELINLYGPTECAIDTVFHRCVAGARTVPIGRPVANTRLYVLDADGASVPPGARGELHIAGAQVGRGYWGNPALTANKFIHLHDERLYKTGDLVRWNEAGDLEYIGRSDDQLKIRGQRIEPAEIEAVLKRQPGVRDCAVIAREDGPGGKRLVAYVTPEQRSSEIELWPSTPGAGGEQFFDEALYRAMTNDHARNDRFREAFNRTVRDKVVVDIGCGKDAILARLCAEAGARKVYAIELLAGAAGQARALVEKMRLGDRITVIQGDVRTLELPEMADVCVSENIGHIGGAEGWDLILAKASHLLKPGAPMIPGLCETMAAAVSLPEDFMRQPKFSELAAYYAGNLFAQAGYQFDLRLSITGTNRSHLRSNIGVFEELDFQSPRPWYTSPLHLTIDKTSRIHGFLLWVRIHMAPGIVFDTIDHQASWLPVFLPVFPAGLAVREGDVIDADVTGALAENGLNRDYAIHGSVLRDGRPLHSFDFTSWHYKKVFKATPFYETLFASGKLPVAPASPALAPAALSHALSAALPPAMVPSAFVILPQLPLLPNGKLDRKSLPAPEPGSPSTPFQAAPAPSTPLTPLRRKVADIWRQVLGAQRIGLHDNFFEIGGDSLTGLRVVNRLREALDEHVSLVVIFEAPTVERLCALLERNYADSVQRWLGVQPQNTAPEAAPRIGEADVAALQALVTPMRKYTGSGPKNPPAIFILSPMRSGSTLLRIMLAGNPRLFAPPELQLLCFETLADRKAAFTGYDKYLHEGLIRAVMEFRRCDTAAAEAHIAAIEREGGGVARLYGEMQASIAPRLLVDKTPDYAMDIEVLRRAEDIFEEPLYIHLARHPLGMIRSYEKGRFILESLFRGRHEFTGRQMAELTWLISHRNIVEFLRGIPAHRQHRVRFEDIVTTPEPVLTAICQWLEIPFAPEMTDPYHGGSKRMTDGIHPMSPQVGDANFYRHGRLNAAVAESWKETFSEDFLSPLTWDLAAMFGYTNPFAPVPPRPAGLNQPITRLSRDQRRVVRSR
ncbi:MAG: amino acid adenylation domain-containing protein [Chthoniobacteraceae bacterium]|jgi:amino acid adenylation domain-containing protein/natural product biosynthesis luciferase-like monooxygenase protein